MRIFMSSRPAWLHSEFQANKGYIARPCLKNRKRKESGHVVCTYKPPLKACAKRSGVRFLTLRTLGCTVRSGFKNLLKGRQNFSNFDEKFPHVLIPLGKRFFPSTKSLITRHQK